MSFAGRFAPRVAVLALVLLAAFDAQAADADPQAESLARRLSALDADPVTAGMAAYERLRARQAVDALAAARSRERGDALRIAQRRVETAEIAARAESAEREVDRLERERSTLLIEASRQDAERARAEAERLRIQAQIQAEEAERLRQQALADQAAMQDIEGTLAGVTGAQTAKLDAARERELSLARQEAELVSGTKLPSSRRDGRGETFTLAGDAFASGQAALTAAARAQVAAIAAYLDALPSTTVQVTGHTDNQGAAAANRALSQRRADAVRQALVSAGIDGKRVRASGVGADRPVADNGSATGRARNRRVEIQLTHP
ncbi:OmpA family protein [Tolypothrix campylonemoides VB511288]|nr:OmpA family protein [Tolypothrix campylonemoides VB511288]